MLTPIAQLPEILESQASKHLTHNQALRQLEGVAVGVVISRTLTTPPSTPAEGAVYIPATGATGAWSGRANLIAIWSNNAWVFVTPWTGFTIFCLAERSYLYHRGSLNWIRFPVIFNTTSALITTFTTSEITAASFTLPGGLMVPHSILEIHALWSMDNNANNKTLRLKLGGTTLYTAVVANAAQHSAVIRIINGATANAQVVSLLPGSSATAFLTTSIDTAVDQTFQATQQLANSGDTVTLQWCSLELK